MPTIQIEAEVSGQDLLKAVEQLNPGEFARFVEEVLTLRARRQGPRLSAPETLLLLRINRGLPEDLRRRYEQLTATRRAQTLTAAEQAELLRLTDEVERQEADRAAALAELAQLRHTSLAALMEALGIRAPTDD